MPFWRLRYAFEHQRQAIVIFEAIGARADLTTSLGELAWHTMAARLPERDCQLRKADD